MTADDREREARVAARLAELWGCQVVSFGGMSPIDCYALRGEQLSAVIEIKGRGHPFGHYGCDLLSMRKWLTLLLAEIGLGVPGLFVVEWADRLAYVDVVDVDPRKLRLTGRRDRPGVANDIEPMIVLPLDIFRPLGMVTA